MTRVESAATDLLQADHVSEGGEAPGRFARWDAWCERVSDRLNPILVKESRQALKSRQFLVTFALVLLCSWAWSLLGVAVLAPEIYWAPRGNVMLAGYFWILNFPLCVVVPFGAFRSLASEVEDGTYSLVSITTLSPARIIAGKLGSAMLQMLVYLSALAPCIAFTYLLSGVDLFMIAFMLFYTVLASVVLSTAGLLISTLSTERHVQTVAMLVLISGLGGLFFFSSVGVTETLSSMPLIPFDDQDFWMTNAAIVTLTACATALLLLAAAARISFESENRSSTLRVVMLIQQAALLGWLALLWVRVENSGALFFLLSVMGMYWGALGMLLVSERPEMSHRVRRNLPQSPVARAFLTWFNPGPGAGYLFAVANLTSCVLLAVAGALYFEITGLPGGPRGSEWIGFALLLLSYVVLYLGAGRLLIGYLRRWIAIGLFRGVLVQAVLLVLGTLVPIVVQMSLAWYHDYTVLQASNPFWSLNEASEVELFSSPAEITISFLLVAACAAAVLVLNLLANRRELAQSPEAIPQRVLEDLAPARPPRNPWSDLEAPPR